MTKTAVVALVLSAWVGSGAAGPQPVAQAGSITGAVRFDGNAPAPIVLQMAADPFCLAAHQGETVTAQRLVVNGNGTLRWTFVYIREAGTVRLPAGSPAPVMLDQVGCMYEPHVFGIQVGAPLSIRNSDSTLHNIHVEPANNPAFNIAQPIPGMVTERTFGNTDVMVPVRCDVHPWMQAYIGVLPHGFFAVTGEDGSFEIGGVPPGDYVVEAWHESLGTHTANVRVVAGQAARADFTFAAVR